MPRPTTRVLAVLDLLQTHGRMSGAELARRIEVDVRTLRRYIVALEDLGVPVTTERGRHGAYMLVSGFRLPPMMFTNDEAVALSVGMLAARGLGLADGAPAVESAQAKLARVMPDGLKRQVRAITETVRIDLWHAPATPESNTSLMTLSTAAQAQQRVHLRYRSGPGAETERDFDPYGLAYHAGAWYALGFCHLRRALRSFRVDRMQGVQSLDLRFERPQRFDALEQLLHSIATVPRGHAIEVLLHADLTAARRAFPLSFGMLEPCTDGVLLRTSADDLGWFARQLAALPFGFDIRTPAELRVELAQHVDRLRALAKP